MYIRMIYYNNCSNIYVLKGYVIDLLLAGFKNIIGIYYDNDCSNIYDLMGLRYLTWPLCTILLRKSTILCIQGILF